MIDWEKMQERGVGLDQVASLKEESRKGHAEHMTSISSQSQSAKSTEASALFESTSRLRYLNDAEQG